MSDKHNYYYTINLNLTLPRDASVSITEGSVVTMGPDQAPDNTATQVKDEDEPDNRAASLANSGER